MGQLLLGLVLGAVVGIAVGVMVQSRRARTTANDLSAARSAQAAAEARATEQQLTIARERENHEQAMAGLSDRFKSLASETLESVVKQFHDGQVQILEQREAKLDERLDPLNVLLQQYKDKVQEFETNRETGFVKVEFAAAQLLEAQHGVMEETKKLNTILGRSSARGRWGEIQLERILEISGMSKYVDFDPQFSMKGSGDTRQRPDVVVHLPHGADIAIDAKVPYDSFDRAMATDDPGAREAALKEYALAMRQHVQSLKKKEYWSSLKVSPSFVICFVPSDHLLSAAFDADDQLFVDALQSHVLVAGPTTLLGLLWSTSLGWRQFAAAENVHEIQLLAERLVERTTKVFDYVNKLGSSISNSSRDYSLLVGSLENNLLVTVRDIQKKGVGAAKGELGSLDVVPEMPRRLEPHRWPQSGDDLFTVDAQVVEPVIELDAGETTADLPPVALA